MLKTKENPYIQKIYAEVCMGKIVWRVDLSQNTIAKKKEKSRGRGMNR